MRLKIIVYKSLVNHETRVNLQNQEIWKLEYEFDLILYFVDNHASTAENKNMVYARYH